MDPAWASSSLLPSRQEGSMAIEMRVVGLDIAKNVFQVHGVDHRGETVLRKRLRRSQVGDFFRQQIPCLIGIEATQGAHYWARVLRTFGQEVRLVAPQFVKPYLKSQKNDANDAEAICEAVSRPSMRFVPSKSIEQQDLQALHRIRSRISPIRKYVQTTQCQNPQRDPHIAMEMEDGSLPATTEAPACGLAIAQFANPSRRS